MSDASDNAPQSDDTNAPVENDVPATESAETPETATPETEAVALAAFIKEETERTRRDVTLTYTIGICASLIISIYMTFLLGQVRSILNPQDLAMVIGSQVEDNLPGLVSEYEAEMAARADDVAANISTTFIEAVPEIAAEGKAQIDRAHEEVIPYLSDEFSAIVVDYIDANGRELQMLAEDNQIDEFASFFTEAMIEEFQLQLDRHLELNYEGRNLAYIQENLNLGLMAIDTKLTELVEADPATLDRRERLQRQLLARLFTSALEAGEE